LYSKHGLPGPGEGWQNPDLPTLGSWTTTTRFGEGTRVVTKRNPYYFKVDTEGKQLPYIDEGVFNIVEDDEVMLLQALNGELDLTTDYGNTLDYNAAFFDNQETGNFSFFEQGQEKINTVILSFNQTSTNPVKREIFQNHDFRCM